MYVKNNYNECLTNLSCSIRKYFDLDYKHNTLDYIDKILEEYKPKNVVTILCDGMGSNIMDRMLDKDLFLMKNRIKPITTVFPATTVAATTSMMTGLNPVETGMLGWDMYYKDIDKTITAFMNSEKGDFEYKSLDEAIEYKGLIDKNGYKKYENNDKTKIVRRHIHEEWNEIFRENRLSEEGKELYKKRKEHVERSFADSKQNHGYRYAMYKGVLKNQHYTWLICAAQNMKNIAIKKSNTANIYKNIDNNTDYFKKILIFLKNSFQTKTSHLKMWGLSTLCRFI